LIVSTHVSGVETMKMSKWETLDIPFESSFRPDTPFQVDIWM
jgi:hypothetical protein